MVAESAPVWW